MRTQRGVAWGLIDQALSSATNFGLSVLAAQLLGPGGLGVVAIGFSVYLAVQTLHRALVVDPLIVTTSRREPPERREGSRAAVTIALAVAVATTVAMVVLGLTVPGPIGRGILLLAPWTGMAVLQDMWRAILFRDGRGAGAALNDAVWAAGMGMMVPIAWVVGGGWAVAAAWGAGAALACILGFVQLRLRPVGFGVAASWWRREAWPFGRWVGLATTVHAVGSQALFLILASLIGAADLGGLRAALVLFAPMSLFGPALTLSALPALARSARLSHRSTLGVAARFSMVALSVLGAYLTVVGLFHERLFSAMFGASFGRYSGLVLPVGLGQLAMAGALGFTVYLRADRRGGSVLIGYGVTILVQLISATCLALSFGVTGATWGIVLGTISGSATHTALALRPAHPRLERSPGRAEGFA